MPYYSYVMDSVINIESMTKLSPEFYLQPTVRTAKHLIGKLLVRTIGRQNLVGRIVETEAYCSDDPASHSFRGRTERNKVMFESGGVLYVYFTYGMHFCANVVTGNEGKGEAVLLRAIEPLAGIKKMRSNRGWSALGEKRIWQLTNGPAKLCQALKIGREENGVDLQGNRIFLLDAPLIPPAHIGTSSRIGISSGLDKQWRFYLKNNPWVSR